MNDTTVLDEKIVLKNETEKLGQDNLIFTISIWYDF